MNATTVSILLGITAGAANTIGGALLIHREWEQRYLKYFMRVMGMKMEEKGDDTAATIIPSVGCPMGCNFCTTSAFFGGKGKWTEFFHTGDEIFQQMLNAERELGVRSFFIMDENFLLNRPRALQLLELMKKNNKAWVLYVFSSMNAIRKYTIDELVQLGVSCLSR